MSSRQSKSEPYPCSIVVIGGGIAGLMSAYHIKSRNPKASVTVIEQGDHIPYKYGSSSRSAACSRQQFGLKLNVEMSIFSTRFYESFRELVGEPDRMFWQQGYLWLYREAIKWADAQQRVKNQQSWGLAEVQAMSADETLREFPMVANHGLLGATFCPTDGFLDPGMILTALKDWIKNHDCRIWTNTHVVNFEFKDSRVTRVVTNLGHACCDYVINCTGAWSSRVGTLLGTKLEVAPEKRYLWSAEFRDRSHDFSDEQFRLIPFTICTADGITPYIKPEPGHSPHSFMVGCEHKAEPEYDFKDEDQARVDPAFLPNVPGGYHERVWTELVDWLPFTEELGFRKHVNSGFYETTAKHSPVIGFDPNHGNVIHCCGFSGHGIMHGPASGATVADLVEYGEYRTFPGGCTELTYDSLVNGTRQIEDMKI